MTTIVKVCDICGKEAAPGTTEAKAIRNLGLHKRAAHGIVGKKYHYYLRSKQFQLTQKGKSGLSPARLEQLANARAARIRKNKLDTRLPWGTTTGRKAESNHSAPTVVQPQPVAVNPCKLDTCPVCGSRFYVATAPTES